MDKLSVFISSSMRLEPSAPSVDWLALRGTIKQTIEATGLFDPFVIEEHASPSPSNAYMLSKVRACEVFVLILGTELRSGTEQEYKEALKGGKPQLVYELDLTHDKRCSDLLHAIHHDDRCTTRKVRPDGELRQAILEDLMEYVILRFRGAPTSLVDRQQGVSFSHQLAAREIPLPLFGESNSLLAEQVGYPAIRQGNYPTNTYLYPLGTAAVRWLLDGAPFELEDFADTLKRALDIREGSVEESALRSRWKACSAYMRGDRREAARILAEARKNTAEPSRIHIGILVDLRNLYGSLGDYRKQSEVQVELDDATKELQYQPYGVGFMHDALQSMQEAQDSEHTRHEGMIIYGNRGVSETMAALSGYLFCSASYGSVTGLGASRLHTAEMLMRYALILEDRGLYIKGLRLLALSDYARELKDWMGAAEGFASAELVAQVHDLWGIARSRDGRLTSCGIYLFERLGPYLDDNTFAEASKAIRDLTAEEGFSAWTQAGEAMAKNAHRMDVGMLTDVIQALADEKQTPRVGGWLTRALLDARIEDADSGTSTRLAHAVGKNVAGLIEHGLDPSVIAVLARRSDAFRGLAEQVWLAIDKDDMAEFEANLDGKPTVGLFTSAIHGAAAQLKLASGDVRFVTSEDYATGLARLLNPTDYLPLRREVEPMLLDLLEVALASEVPTASIDSLVVCAIKLASMYQSAGIKLPKRLRHFARQIEKRNVPQGTSSAGYEGKTWSLRAATLSQICDIGTKHGIIRLMGEVPGSSVQTRVACAECLEAYLLSKSGEAPKLQDVAALMNIVLMLGRDRLPTVRSGAVRCAMMLVRTQSGPDAKDFIRQKTKDPSPLVRISILRDGERLLKDGKFYEELSRFLENDEHFEIRMKALRSRTR